MIDKKKQGKKNREKGQRFELKVRKDMESKGWFVDRWSNNVEFEKEIELIDERKTQIIKTSFGKLVPAKSRFGLRTTGFPDFIGFRKYGAGWNKDFVPCLFEIIGIECKMGGYLSKEEKEKCRWLLTTGVFSKILIASRGEKRGSILYREFEK